MTRRDWWVGIVVLALAIVLHAAVPRYDWRSIRGVPMLCGYRMLPILGDLDEIRVHVLGNAGSLLEPFRHATTEFQTRLRADRARRTDVHGPRGRV